MVIDCATVITLRQSAPISALKSEVLPGAQKSTNLRRLRAMTNLADLDRRAALAMGMTLVRHLVSLVA